MISDSALIGALKLLGFEDHQIRNHGEEKVQLKGYGGRLQSNRANIVVQGRSGGADRMTSPRYDIGFEKREDGTYNVHLESDDYQFDADWRKKLQQNYTRAVVTEQAEMQGLFITEDYVNEEGEIMLTLTSPY
jgi:hypothetical protein